jgi:phosphoserine phosphatase
LARALDAETEWLSPDEALVVNAPLAKLAAAKELIGELLQGLPCDWALIPGGLRRRKLLLADMDSTMITIECIDELADAVGIREPVAAITRRAMNGEIDFAAALRERVALLEGLAVAKLEEICRERVRASPGARTLVATMRQSGAFCGLVSGGFRQFTGHVRDMLGFDTDEANELEVREGRLTGRLVPPLRDASSKLATLHAYNARRDVALEETLALGDGANDLPMLHAAGLGVAYRAHATVRRQMETRIDATSLCTALFYQGYHREEFVQA